MSHSYALARVSRATYDEVRRVMDAAGYADQFINDPRNPGNPRLVMHGIALVTTEPEEVVESDFVKE